MFEITLELDVEQIGTRAVSVEMAMFTPAQLADIAALSTTQQRDWRRRGLLPTSGDGHARFDPITCASMMVMKSLTAFGIGPGYSSAICKTIAHEIVASALYEKGLEITSVETLPSIVLEEAQNALIREICDTEDSVPASYGVVFADATLHLTSQLDPELQFSQRPAIVVPIIGYAELFLEAVSLPLVRARIQGKDHDPEI